MSLASPEGNTPLHYAVLSDNPLFVESLLFEGYQVNAQNRLGQTPLHVAYKHEQIGNAVVLIRRGADLYIKDVTGKLPTDYDVNTQEA